MNALFRNAGALVFLLLLSGCGVIDQSQAARAVALNKSMDSTINDTILVNILRAANYQPVTFNSVPKLTGEQSVGLDNGLPTITFGPGQTLAQHQFVFGSNKITNSAKGALETTTLSTTKFTLGVMSEINIKEIDYLIRQGISRDLIFNLLIDSIEYDDQGIRKIIKNDLANLNDRNAIKSFVNFQITIQLLSELGLTVQQVIMKDDYKLQKDSPNFKGLGKFCFNKALANSKFNFNFSAGWQCKTDTSVPIKGSSNGPIDIYCPSTNTLYKKIGNVVFRVRSVVGIYNYLGQLVRLQELISRSGLQIEELLAQQIKSDEPSFLRQCSGARDLASGNLTRFMATIQFTSGNECFASAFLYGRSFCVPAIGAKETKQAFSILGQLQALRTDPSELPFTPTVRVQQF